MAAEQADADPSLKASELSQPDDVVSSLSTITRIDGSMIPDGRSELEYETDASTCVSADDDVRDDSDDDDLSADNDSDTLTLSELTQSSETSTIEWYDDDVSKC